MIVIVSLALESINKCKEKLTSVLISCQNILSLLICFFYFSCGFSLQRSILLSFSGKVAIIGGCREYTGAPYFAAISALKIVSSVTSMSRLINVVFIYRFNLKLYIEHYAGCRFITCFLYKRCCSSYQKLQP